MVKQKEPAQQNVMVGVFITRKHAKDLVTMNPQFLSSHRYIRFIELARASQDVDFALYFFTSNRVNFARGCVMGIYYDQQKDSWGEKIFPLPHLLYDRGGGLSPKSMRLINTFRELGIHNINARHFFDKWDLYERLSRLDTISPHLPVTVKGDKGIDILQMLNKYGDVYVKTRRGSCGLGVIRIEKLGPDRYGYYYSYGGRLISEIFTGLELKTILYQYFSGRPFIIQEPIDLLRKGQCNIDFRSEVQKDEKGRLIVTGTTARIGRPRSPITSNTRTEDYYPVDEFIRCKMQLDEPKASVLQAKIDRFLHLVFRAVEQVYGSFGEMGIDFGLDARGHLWLIECNSKSAKVALYYAYGPHRVRQSFCNTLKYAGYLVAKQNNDNSRKKVHKGYA